MKGYKYRILRSNTLDGLADMVTESVNTGWWRVGDFVQYWDRPNEPMFAQAIETTVSEPTGLEETEEKS